MFYRATWMTANPAVVTRMWGQRWVGMGQPKKPGLFAGPVNALYIAEAPREISDSPQLDAVSSLH